ncbi:hypothetical protein PsYK624_138170 [Phanerochaete sordida]|uniref:Uncharacterized protein n=1 Tax=Phanerochaete sordida TaxID=48140 RepID=A0A9P3GM87_9APHY|nr:hypothetical protein PsYK624_138170 [Phanerochaete sordida]
MLPTLAELLTAFELMPRHPCLGPTIETIDGERWVRIKGVPGRPAAAAAARRFHSERFSADKLDRFEYVYWEPDWFDHLRPWKGYAPDVVHALADAADSEEGTTETEWMFSFLDDANAVVQGQPAKVRDDILSLIARDFSAAALMLQMAGRLTGLTAELVLEGYQYHELLKLRGPVNVLNGVRRARVKMFDLLGAISFAYDRADDTTRAITRARFQVYWDRWFLGAVPKIGYLLDLRDDRDARLPLIDFVSHNVPLYYPVDDEYVPKIPLARRLGEGPELTEENYLDMVQAVIPHELPRYPRSSETAGDTPLLRRLQTNAPHTFPVAREVPDQEPRPVAADEDNDAMNDDESTLGDSFVRALRLLRPIWGFHRAPPRAMLGLQWNAQLLARGRLALSEVAELKLRTWARLYGVDDVTEVLAEAMRRGIPFHVDVRESALDAFRPRFPAPPIETPEYLRPGYVEEPLVLPRDRVASFAIWKERAARILARPHAVAALFAGGILWRLALEFGPVELAPRAAEGPSATVLVHGAGDVLDGGFVRDALDDTEVDVLLGKHHCPASNATKLFWPSPDAFRYADWNDNEWTSRHEEWFLATLRGYQNDGSLQAPQSRYRWNRELMRMGLSARAADGAPPSAALVHRALARIRGDTGRHWDGQPATRVRVD